VNAKARKIMKIKMMDLAIFWLPIIGGILLGGFAVSAYFGGNKTAALWVGFFGFICFCLVAALQIQQAIWKSSGPVVDDTEIRKSRAYVFIDTIRTSSIDDDLTAIRPDKIASILVVVKNTGQTPAFKFWHHASIRIADFPPPADLFSVPVIQLNSIDNLPPGGFAQITVGLGRPLNDSEKTLLGLGRMAVYLFGEIGYNDVFGIKRCTKYRYRVGGDVGFNGTAMAPMAEGNEVDANCTE
jgi:hypothetical protein